MKQTGILVAGLLILSSQGFAIPTDSQGESSSMPPSEVLFQSVINISSVATEISHQNQGHFNGKTPVNTASVSKKIDPDLMKTPYGHAIRIKPLGATSYVILPGTMPAKTCKELRAMMAPYHGFKLSSSCSRIVYSLRNQH